MGSTMISACAASMTAVGSRSGAARARWRSIRKACGSGCRWRGRCCNDPKILLLDEPFSNVDVRSAREMVTLLAQMRDAGKTIFVVTHQAVVAGGRGG